MPKPWTSAQGILRVGPPEPTTRWQGSARTLKRSDDSARKATRRDTAPMMPVPTDGRPSQQIAVAAPRATKNRTQAGSRFEARTTGPGTSSAPVFSGPDLAAGGAEAEGVGDEDQHADREKAENREEEAGDRAQDDGNDAGPAIQRSNHGEPGDRLADTQGDGHPVLGLQGRLARQRELLSLLVQGDLRSQLDGVGTRQVLGFLPARVDVVPVLLVGVDVVDPHPAQLAPVLGRIEHHREAEEHRRQPDDHQQNAGTPDNRRGIRGAYRAFSITHAPRRYPARPPGAWKSLRDEFQGLSGLGMLGDVETLLLLVLRSPDALRQHGLEEESDHQGHDEG